MPELIKGVTTVTATYASRAARLPKDRFATSPGASLDSTYLYPGYKLFFHHVQESKRTMADLVAADRGPRQS